MLAIAIHNKNQHQQKRIDGNGLRLGTNARQTAESEEVDVPFFGVEDPLIGENQLFLRWGNSLPAGTIELTNHDRSLALSSGPRVHAGCVMELTLPVSFCVGDSQIQIFDDDADHALDSSLIPLAQTKGSGDSESSDKGESPGSQTLAAWLDTLSELQRATAGSQAFFELAARAVFNPGGLDGGLILLPTTTGWEIAASHLPYPDHGIVFREDLVRKSVASRSTIYHDANFRDHEENIDDLHAAVVCPVTDENGEVVAAVYGFRSLHRQNNRHGVRFLEAQFVQVVANSLSAGMIRLESEANASRSKVLLEQAFSRDIVRQLQSNPGFLESQDREVSVLFADLRGFTSISERIGTRNTYELLANVMDRFSNIITDLDGVIIDFYGDGVSAFWNAPIDQPDHAVLACQTGFEMLASLPELNDIWAGRIGQQLKIGVGIHTGKATVGNSGSRTRLKYGPRGSTVNLASRLEAQTKRIGVPLVVSGETAAQVAHVFYARRIIRAELRGINNPTDICRLFPKTQENKSDPHLSAYEEALGLFESGKLTDAQFLLADLQLEKPEDPITDFLLDLVTQEKNRIGKAADATTKSSQQKTDGIGGVRLDEVVIPTNAATRK